MSLAARCWIALVLAGPLAAVQPAAAQTHTRPPPRITVRVGQIAGTSMYLAVGTRNGVAKGDTLSVFAEGSGAFEGKLLVMAATETRSVLTFAGRAFPVTRGGALVLQLLREPAQAPPAVPASAPPAVAATSDTAAAADTVEAGSAAAAATALAPQTSEHTPEMPRRPAHGSLSFNVSSMHSTTHVGGLIPGGAGRTFATPTMGLDVTVPQAIGPLSLHTSAYLSYRYSSGDIVQPATAIRVYSAALEGDFSRFRFMLGRFHSPVDSYSGFWDGALVRVGGPGFGVGAIGGFEPNLWDQRPSLATPKAAVFVDGRANGQGWWWSGNLTADAVRPKNLPDHTFIGMSQRFSTGRVWLSHDLEVARDPTTGGWKISRLYLRASVELTSRLQLHTGFGRSEPWVAQLPGFQGPPFGPRNDQVDAGLSLQAGGGYLFTDFFTGSDALSGGTKGATGTFTVPRLPDLESLGLSGSVSWWSGKYGTTLFAAPSIILDLSGRSLRVGYRMSRADFLGRTTKTNGAELSLDAPLAEGLRFSGRLDAEFGSLMNTQSLQLGLYRVF